MITEAERATPRKWRTIVSTGAGNALEWFDWNAYAVFTPFFAAQFFPAHDSTSAVLSSLAIFAVGFLMRPLGGLLFGWFGDRIGRRSAMVGSIALASGGSLLIGIAPTYESIGIGAALLLVVARLCQGLGHGGEMPAVQTYIAEMAPRGRRGIWSSLVYTSGTCGILASSALAAALAGVLPPGAMSAWGWRVPFLLGGVVGLYTLVMRLRLAETQVFDRQRATDRPPLWRSFWEQRTACLRVIGLTVGGTVVFYTWVVSAPAQAISVHHLDPSAALWVGALANAVFILVLPLFGALSDRIGRRPVLLMSFVGSAMVIYPLSWLIQDQIWQFAVAMIIALLVIAPGPAIMPTVYAELFPTRMRTAGAGFPYAIATAAFGGSAPYLQTWLASSGRGDVFLGYAVILLLISAVVAYRMPETKNIALD
ncbi:MFS transporter [Saccharopolyspora sp. NPDC050642]|uniref:MFS transporter n=1 Tax=Saccharopolyspora sp. NPDC050642 TaxID=3157099 RepID=UPI003403F8F3